MIPSDKVGNTDKAAVLDILYQSPVKLTPRVFIKEIRRKFKVSPADARKIVNDLIHEQELCYHQLYGSTYIEQSFLKPVRITDHFILSPPGFKETFDDTCHTIIIEPGISFGTGHHPTTRLCLEAIDDCFYGKRMIKGPDAFVGADVGTGSGVLALALVKAGLRSCRGYEIDPVSVNEAKKNIAANCLGDQILVVDNYFETSPGAYAVICANLRYPTLKMLSNMICSSLQAKGMAVLSGLRDWEKEDLICCYQDKGMTLVWQKDEKQWSAVMFLKSS